MEWSNDNVLMLIESYKERPLLWDTTNNLYKLKHKKNEAWLEIGAMFNVNGSVMKQKMNSILASFRRECRKESKRDGGKKSSWFAFDSMAFLKQQYKQKRVLYSSEYSKDEQKDQSDDDEFFGNRDSENEDCDDKLQETFINIKAEEIDPEELDTTVILPQVIAVMEKPALPPPKYKTLEDLKKCVLVKRKKRLIKYSKFHRETNVQNALLKKYLCQDSKREGNSIFGEHVANKLRGYDNKTRNIVQHLINNILFDADMGKYD